MRREELLGLIVQIEEKNQRRLRENVEEVLKEEFIMNQVFYRFMEYMKACNGSGEPVDMLERMKKSEAPVKKTKDFDISHHDTASRMYLHKHTYLELDYVYQGSCQYYIKDDLVFTLQEKQLCIVNQNIIHGIDTLHKDDLVIKCMIPFEYLDLEQFDEIGQEVPMKRFLTLALNENVTKAAYMVYNIKNRESIEELMYQLMKEFVRQEAGLRRAVKNYLSILFLHLMRYGEYEIQTARELKEENLNITKVLDCIRKNYQYITLKDIAEDLHFHENYLSRMIKQNTKRNFRELLREYRLKEAENLLLNTDLSITEIALRIGYYKPNFFYKLFKEHHGMTPIEFRTRNSIQKAEQ